MWTDTILALVALTTAVIGTILNPKRWIKTLIISLACAAAIATIVKAFDDNHDKTFIKRALDAQLANSAPPNRFMEALDDAITRVALKHGLHDDGNFKKGEDSVYWFTRTDPNRREGAWLLNGTARGEAFVQYIEGKPLDDMLEPRMFPGKPPKRSREDEELDRAELLYDLSTMATASLDDHLAWITPETDMETTIDRRTPAVEVRAIKEDETVTVGIDKPTIERLAAMPPISRYLEAYEHCRNQLRQRQSAGAP